MARGAAAAALALAALVASFAACSRERALFDARLPSTSTAARVLSVAPRGPYLDVEIETAGERLRFFAPRDPEVAGACERALRPAADVRYVHDGILGRLDVGEERCELVGVLSLAKWRDRRPRGSREPIPRSRATFRVVYRDEELALARGRFGLAGELGWVGGADTVAVFQRGALCDEVLERGVASLEYRHEGDVVLALVAGDGLCPLLGIARPRGPERG